MKNTISEIFENAAKKMPLKLTNTLSGLTALAAFGATAFYGNGLKVGLVSAGVWALSGVLLKKFRENPFSRADVDPQGYSPENDLINAGKVRLNALSPYLSDLPDTATAKFLVAKHDLGDIDAQGDLDTWISSVHRIEDIRDYYGLDGMQLSADKAETETYEQEWAGKIREQFIQAISTGKEVMTGLFMPTLPLTNGAAVKGQLTVDEGEGDMLANVDFSADPRGIVEYNMFALRDMIEERGNKFENDPIFDRYYTMSQPLNGGTGYYDSKYWIRTVNLVNGETLVGLTGTMKNDQYRTKEYHHTRPVALAIQP